MSGTLNSADKILLPSGMAGRVYFEDTLIWMKPAVGASFEDPFNQANGTILEDTADYSKLYNFGTNRLAASGGEMVSEIPGGALCWMYCNTILNQDQFAECILGSSVPSGSDWGRLIVRTSAANRYVTLKIRKTSLELLREGPSGYTNLAAFTKYAHNGGADYTSGDHLRLEADGSEFRAYLNGSLLGSANDTDITAGKVSIFMGGDASWGYFKCGDL